MLDFPHPRSGDLSSARRARRLFIRKVRAPEGDDADVAPLPGFRQGNNLAPARSAIAKGTPAGTSARAA